MTRQEYNLEICKLLTQIFSDPKCEHIRFFQMLFNMDLFKVHYDELGNIIGVGDPFPIESRSTYNQLTKYLEENA